LADVKAAADRNATDSAVALKKSQGDAAAAFKKSQDDSAAAGYTGATTALALGSQEFEGMPHAAVLSQ
jgi:hypothetical protein